MLDSGSRLLSRFSVENYRAFARRQDIDVRPLTLFFGWNSGGKSALVRFLPLLAESLRIAGPPIWLAGDVGRGATWPELVCRASERGTLRFALQWSDAFQAEWGIAGDLEGRWQETESLTIGDGTSSERVVGAEGWGVSGLLPKEAGPHAQLDRLKADLRLLASSVQWISGVRVRPPRVATYGGGAAPILRGDGGNAVDHLIAAQLRGTEDPLLATTQIFFERLGEQLVLDNPTEGVWRVMLHPKQAPRGRVNLCDTGEGYAQVLPVLVALARARVEQGAPRILCLEQPELHLHTRAQMELSKLLVETAKDTASPSLLVETHSEVLLKSVQLAIANGEIAPDLVRVYWVESRSDGTSNAIGVDFDDMGKPKSTKLMGAFGEAIQLGQELVGKQLARRKQ